ncbi:lysoplasmalogenase family protein [Flavobacterium selenitireducens]|uniref:lysoplasmalogenase family protein n=1 Tax=Flavobacterium selenitireducens TaxID=2722704 RepID=UPI00168AF9A1|nr:lysoplasmalogenase family protein [Flavobacterium selenitireducens]MBD3582943.1 hypothetical protein [Flavobacterium selenitireducens]
MEKITRSAVVNFFVVAYAVVSSIEIAGEYFYDQPLIWASKPFMNPLLAIMYWLSSKKANFVFLLALAFSWIANLFFISRSLDSIALGAYVFLAYRVLIIYVVLRLIAFPGWIPVVLGSLPFVFIYMYVINVSHEEIGDGLYMFIMQGLFISFLGGLSVGNYILRSDGASTLLLISTMMFAFTQFLFVIRLYYLNLSVFQSLAMALFALGQFILCKFVVMAESDNSHSRSIVVD